MSRAGRAEGQGDPGRPLSTGPPEQRPSRRSSGSEPRGLSLDTYFLGAAFGPGPSYVSGQQRDRNRDPGLLGVYLPGAETGINKLMPIRQLFRMRGQVKSRAE